MEKFNDAFNVNSKEFNEIQNKEIIVEDGLVCDCKFKNTCSFIGDNECCTEKCLDYIPEK